MDDTFVCPICNNRLRNINYRDKNLLPVNKTTNYVERTCIGMNHFLQFFVDGYTQQIDFLKLSLNPVYSIYIEIDFVNTSSRISCMKDGRAPHIDISKVIYPDFPKLTILKEKIAMFITFS